MKAFQLITMPDEEYYSISITDELFNYIGIPITGSYSVLQARILGMDFYDYCRMIRDNFHFEITISSQGKYPRIKLHKDYLSCGIELLKILNRQFTQNF